MKKAPFIIIVIILLLYICETFVFASDPYYNYTYDFNGQIQQEPQAYLPERIINGESLGTQALNSPQDVFVSSSNKIYICDTGNNRILVLDDNFTLVSIIEKFEYNGFQSSFDNPSSVYVTKDDYLYVADSNNKRIVQFDSAGVVVKIYNKPSSPMLTSKYSFVPLKIAVDSYKRIYVVVQNESNGIIQLDQNGEFLGYYGAIAAPFNLYRRIFMLVASKEQKANMVKNIPTVYSNITLDDLDFLYGTVGSIDVKYIADNTFYSMFIHKLNPLGTDILRRYGNVPPMGDYQFMTDYTANTATPLPSLLTDIALRDGGIYSVLDQRMGRIFTYDSDGNLLFIFGGLGSRLGQFSIPVALDILHDDQYIVLDSKYSQLVLFKPTEYATMITTPLVKYFNHEYDSVLDYWQTSLKYTANSELVYGGMSKALYQRKEYQEAMQFANLANDRKQYSFALQEYRKSLLQVYFGPVLTALLFSIILIIIGKRVNKIWKRRKCR